MQILITDVTEMHQGNYCVAGWNLNAGTMVRPLPNGEVVPLCGTEWRLG